MKSEVENVSDVKKIIHIEIPWEDVDKHLKQAIRLISKSARIPGFRPGKAPENLVRTKYAQQIKDEVMNHMIPEAYNTVLSENKFDIVSEPSLHDVLYAEGSPFLFKVTIETRPTVQLKDYKGLDLTAQKIETTEEEIESVLKTYQERAAELIPLPDVAAADGHYIGAKLKADVVGDKKQKAFDDRTLIRVGSDQNHPVVNENLIGKKAGEIVEFDVPYAEDYQEKSLAGKTLHYRVEIESVNDRKLPELDDEFAKDLSEFASLSDLKEKIRQDIINHKTSQQRSAQKDEALQKLIDSHQFDVPESLTKKETEGLMKEYAYTLHRSGANLDDPKLNWSEIHAHLSHQAERNVRGVMIVQAIADEEKIEVTEEDVDQAISRIADQQRRAPEAVKAELLKEERIDRLKSNLRITKTLEFLVDNANIKNAE